MRSRSQRKTQVALALVVLAASAAALLWQQQRQRPKRFAAVVEGRLYRCGDLRPHQLEYVVRKYGVRTVLSLLNPDVPESIAEREAADRLGLHWVNVPLVGSGASTPEQREQIKAVLFNPEVAPTLVHCAAGTNRTGLAVGMYRLHQQGWTVEQVLDEMREFGFEDLPRHQDLREALAGEWLVARRASQAATRSAGP